MQYRVLGKTGQRVSALGCGAMRLPTLGDPDKVDEAAAIEMLRYAFDHGVNYVDTAYPYHGGNSERVVGRALQHGYRDRVLLATKLPVWEADKAEDFDRLFDEQCRRLDVDRIDFYLLHCLQETFWPKVRDLGVLDWAERLQADGRIGHFGFSFHDRFDVFQKIVDAYDWSFCQIQYNLVSEDVQAGTRGLQYASERGLGVLIMEPLFGGTLASPPPAVDEIWRAAGRNPVDVALRWLWSKPEVSMVLSGMSTLDQVRENLAIADRSGVGQLSEQELQVVRRVQQKYDELSPVPCTKCGYCMPCPHGVDIPRNFELYNQTTVYGGTSQLLCRNLYIGLPEEQRATACQACRLCEEKCPQQIEISRMLDRVAEHFGSES